MLSLDQRDTVCAKRGVGEVGCLGLWEVERSQRHLWWYHSRFRCNFWICLFFEARRFCAFAKGGGVGGGWGGTRDDIQTFERVARVDVRIQ